MKSPVKEIKSLENLMPGEEPAPGHQQDNRGADREHKHEVGEELAHPNHQC